jgi:uncharacterized surface protein with fasciclin (FAS1) repeats
MEEKMKSMYTKMMTGMWMTGMKSWQAMCRSMETKTYDRCESTMNWEATCSPRGCEDKSAVVAKRSDLVHTALEGGDFNILAQAIKASGLEDTLRKAGPFTVFAPRDDAFSALPAGTLEHLLKPENQSDLKRLLLYHIIPGQYTAAEVVQLNCLYTLSGNQVSIRVSDSDVLIDKARVVKTDVMGTNGVIHVIDAVLTPDQA